MQMLPLDSQPLVSSCTSRSKLPSNVFAPVGAWCKTMPAVLFCSIISTAALAADNVGRGIRHCAASTRGAVHCCFQRREVPGQGADALPEL